MPYNKLPNTFLKLPDIGNIDHRPEDPYPFSTLGMIHSSKFKQLCKIVLEQVSTIPVDITEQFKGHRLEGVVENLELDELADIIRHTLAINKSKIGWEIVDEINYKLDKKYTPRWELPDLYFDKGIRETFISRINWKPTESIQEAMKLFFHQYEELTGNSLFTDTVIDPMKTKIWSFKDLYIILNESSYLIDAYSSELSDDIYRPLINQLFSLFEENYRNKIYTTEQQIILLFLSVKATIESDMIEISKLKILLDNSMNLIRQLDEEARKSYRLLYGFVYSIFWYRLFEDTSDLIMQRDLIAEIIEDIYKPENMELTDWAKFIIDSKAHPLVISLLLSGYTRLTKMLHQYAEALPDSNQRKNLFKIRSDLIVFIHDLNLKYLESYFGLKLKTYELKPYYREVSRRIPYTNFNRLIFLLLKMTFRYQLIHDNQLENQDTILQNYIDFLHDNMTFGIAKLYELELLIQVKQYRYDYYLAAIEEEFDIGQSLILSSTFEENVIKVIGEIFSAIQDKNNTNDKIIIEHYEIMILFVLNWMLLLYNDDVIRYEVIMILSPLVSIAYIQIAKGYLERNNLEAAFLAYFNSYYLMELVNQDVKGGMKHTKTDGGDLNEKFHNLMKEWNIEEISDQNYVNKLFRTIEKNIKDRSKNRQDKSFSMGGMLADDIVMGYLDGITKLESFNQLVDQFPTVRAAIIESEIYQPPKFPPKFLSDLYGITLNELLQQQFPFPIIRNLSVTAIGIKLYPIELKLPEESLKLDKPVPDVNPPNVDEHLDTDD